MKKVLLTLIITSAFLSSNAQSTKYLDFMKKAVAEIDSAKTAEEFTILSNKFDRIATVEKSEWLPYYYSSFCQVSALFMNNDFSKADEVIDGVNKLLAKADSLSPNNSEIYVLKSMATSAKIMVDPQSRGMQYGMQAQVQIATAIQLDENNPRAYFLQGQSLFYTPEAFGGGKEKGCAMLMKSKEKFETFVPASSIAPNWGNDAVKMILTQGGCIK